ncbi:MAG TPA: hypothetical protein DD640_02285 [Clostridiales bacterium]|nr:hypothetical protein [Clostridiales bacterium]
MLTQADRKRHGRIFWCGLIAAAAVFCLQPWLGLPLAATAETTVAAGEDTDQPYHPALEISHSAASAVVLETGRLRCLYEKRADQLQNIPAAAKLMTALIACERLSLKTMVTISKVAAAAEEDWESPDEVSLDTGDKYALDYLLHRLIFYNSDAAALAIAEQIANVEADFVDLMNAKAASFDLADTVFVNCTGKAVYSDMVVPSNTTDDFGSGEVSPPLQYTTPNQLARLVSYAIANEKFVSILRKESEYFVLEGGTLLAPMRNELKNVWTLSEGMITGAFYSEENNLTYMVAIGTVNGISLIAVLAGGSTAQKFSDLIEVFQACADTYVLTPLAEAGVAFLGAQEQTVDGELFGLVYKKTVYYVHPSDDLFVKSTLRYNSFGPFSRPIQRSMTAGQVIFELTDGTTIAVDVAPDRQILSSISILDKGLSELQNNRNLFVILMIAAGTLLLILLLQVVSGIKKLVGLVHLVVLEKKSRR